MAIFIISMLFVAVSGHAVIFLISWEIMSLSSFFLLSFENEKKDVFEAGIYYLVAMHICVILLTVGFAIASTLSGSFDFTSFKASQTAMLPAFIFLFLGFAFKAGLMPFHTWLPLAHPAAPGHISAMMSGIMINLGIYGILRMLTIFPMPGQIVSFIITMTGLCTALLGIYYAMAQRDIKRALAYSSIENMGIITAAIGLGMIGLNNNNPYMAVFGFSGALLHVLNHSVFKEVLFFGAGSVYARTHTRDIEQLGGLSKQMPYTSLFFGTASAAISSLPLLNGFISEFLIYLAMFAGIKIGTAPMIATGVFSAAALSFVGGMAIITFTKIYGTVFSGTLRNTKYEPGNEENKYMIFAMGCGSAICAAIGLFPQYAFKIAFKPAAFIMSAVGLGLPDISPIYQTLKTVSIFFMSIAAVVLILYLIKKRMLKGKIKQASTWGCGYQAQSSRVQYTASSYASTFLLPAGPLLMQEEEKISPKGLFPEQASYRSWTHDIVETGAIKPAAGVISSFMRRFSWIQSGNTQQYILYGLIFLILSILWVMGAK
jgi:formate hydrogenlyase subunit 3/multisubunit Na+/H+ antiporter MnhD subunit